MTNDTMKALEQAEHAIAYAKEMDLDDDQYVEICPMTLGIWKTIRSALSAVGPDVAPQVEEIAGLEEALSSNQFSQQNFTIFREAARKYLAMMKVNDE